MRQEKSVIKCYGPGAEGQVEGKLMYKLALVPEATILAELGV